MVIKIRFLIAATLLLICSAAGEEEEAPPPERPFFGVEAEPEVWWYRLKGEIQADTDALTGSRVDLENDLDMDSREIAPGLRTALWFGEHRFRFRYHFLENEGERTLSREIRFGGKTFPASERVESKLRLDAYDLLWEGPFPKWNREYPLRIDYRVGLFLGDFEAELESSSRRRKESFLAAVPQAGLAFQYETPLGEWFLEGKGAWFDTGEAETSFFDGEAGIEWRWKRLAVRMGYRYLRVDLESDDIEAELTWRGPFLSAGFRF